MPEGFSYKDARITPPASRKGVWRIRRGRIDRTAQSMEEAIDVAREIAGLDADAAESTLTVNRLADLWLDEMEELARTRQVSSRYVTRLESHVRLWIRPVIGTFPLHLWVPTRSREVLTRCRDAGLADVTVQGIGATMRGLVTYAQHSRLLTDNPMLAVSYQPRAKHERNAAEVDPETLPTLDDLKVLYKGFRTVDEERLGLGVELIAGSGIRFGEFVGLRPCDVAQRPRVLTVARSYDPTTRTFDMPKSGRVRRTIYPASLELRLEALCDEVAATTGPNSPLFFGDKPGLALSRHYFGRRWYHAAKAAGWKTRPRKNETKTGGYGTALWTPHDLRHYFACWALFDLKADPADVSAWLGHFSVEFTIRRYVGVRGDTIGRGNDLTADW